MFIPSSPEAFKIASDGFWVYIPFNLKFMEKNFFFICTMVRRQIHIRLPRHVQCNFMEEDAEKS